MEASSDFASDLGTMLDGSQQQGLYTLNSHASDDLFNSNPATFANPSLQQPRYNNNQGGALSQPCSTFKPAVLNINESQSDGAYSVAAEGGQEDFYDSSTPGQQHMTDQAFRPQSDGYIQIDTNASLGSGKCNQQCSTVYANRPGSTTSSSQSRQTISTHYQQEQPVYSCPPGSSHAAQHSRAEDADPSMHQYHRLNFQYLPAGLSDAPQGQLHGQGPLQGWWQGQHDPHQYQPDAEPTVQPDQHLNVQYQLYAVHAVPPDASLQWEPDTQRPWQRLVQDDDFELDADTQFNSSDASLQAEVVDGKTQHADHGGEAAQHAQHAGGAAQHGENLMQDAEMLQQQETAMDFAAAYGVESLLECVQEVLQQSTTLNSPMGRIQAPTSERLHELLIEHGLLHSTGGSLHVPALLLSHLLVIPRQCAPAPSALTAMALIDPAASYICYYALKFS